MRNPIIFAILSVLLIASFTLIIAFSGPTQQQRKDEFLTACGHAGFSASQCSFLFASFNEKAQGTDLTTLTVH